MASFNFPCCFHRRGWARWWQEQLAHDLEADGRHPRGGRESSTPKSWEPMVSAHLGARMVNTQVVGADGQRPRGGPNGQYPRGGPNGQHPRGGANGQHPRGGRWSAPNGEPMLSAHSFPGIGFLYSAPRSRCTALGASSTDRTRGSTIGLEACGRGR